MKHWFSMNGLPGFQASETFLEDFDVEVGTTLYRLQRAGALAPAPENPAALLKRSIAQSPTPLGNSSQWKGVPGAPDLLFVPWDPSMALPNVPKRAPEPGLIDPMGPQQDVAPVRTLIPEPTTASRNDELGLQGRAALTAPSAPHSLPPAPREARQVPVTAAQTNISGGAASSSEPTLGAMRRTLDGFLSDYAKRDLTQEQSRLSTELALSLSRTVDTAMALRATEFDAIRGAFEAERGRWEAEKEALLKLRKSTSDGFDRLKEERDALLGQVERLKKSASVEFGRLKEERDAAVNELERLKKSTSEGLDRLKEERDAAVGELERLKATHDHAQAHQTDSSSLPANVIDQIQSAVRQALAQGRSAHQDEPPAHADDNLADDEPRSKRRRTGATSASKAQEAPATRKRKGRPPAAVTPDDYTPPMAIDPVKQESLPKNDPPLPISHQLDTPAGPMQDSLRPSDGGAADVSAALEAAAAVHAPAAPILQLPAPQPPAPQGKRSKAKKQNNSAKSGHSVTAAGGMGSIEDELRQAGGNQSWYFPRGGQVEVRGGQMLYRSTPTTWAAGLGPMLAYPGPRPPSTHHLGLQSGLGSHQLAASGQQQSSGTIPSGDRTAVTASTFPYAESIQYYGRLTQDPKVTWKSMADQASSLVGSAMSYTQPRMRKDTTLSLTPTLQSQNKTFHGEDSATVSARRMQLISKGATLPASLPGNINSYYEAGRQAGGHAGGDSASQGHSEAVQQPQFIHYPPQNQ